MCTHTLERQPLLFVAFGYLYRSSRVSNYNTHNYNTHEYVTYEYYNADEEE